MEECFESERSVGGVGEMGDGFGGEGVACTTYIAVIFSLVLSVSEARKGMGLLEQTYQRKGLLRRLWDF